MKNRKYFLYAELASFVLFMLYIMQIGYINLWISILLSFGVVNISIVLLLTINNFFAVLPTGKSTRKFIFLINIGISTLFGVFLTIFLIRFFILKKLIIAQNEILPIIILLLSSVFLIILAYMLLKNRYQKQLLEAEYLKRINLESKLKALRSRLNSHFLFNLLENIVEVVRTSPKDAENALLCLANLYRESLNAPETWVLKREGDFIIRYLELEQLRFSNRLEYQVNIPSNIENIKIPALLIQPLVENSITHGLRYSKGGFVVVEAYWDKEFATIEVSNSGDFSNDIRFGHGLSIVRDRLKSYFGTNATIKITLKDQYTVAVLKFKPERS